MTEVSVRGWLLAGALATGIGAALVGGCAVASAAPSAGQSAGDATPERNANRTVATDPRPDGLRNSRSALRTGAVTSAAASPAVRTGNRAIAPAAARTVGPTRVPPASAVVEPAPVVAAAAETPPPATPRTAVHEIAPRAAAVTAPATGSVTGAPAAAATAAPSLFGLPPGPIMAAVLAAQAYIYGYPLMEYERVRAAAPTLNTFINLTTFANPDVAPIWQAIGGGKRPNVDTFYSVVELDLSNGPVVLSVPDMGSRYYSFQLTDPYTNVTGYINSRTYGSGPGTYAITWTGGPQGPIPVGATVVEVPYASMLMLGRTLAGDTADQQTAISLINQYTLTPTGATPPNNAILPANSSGIAYLNAMSDAITQNPPPAADADTLARIARIGVGAGLQVADANLGILSTIAVDVAVNLTAAILPALAQLQQTVSALQHHGWAIPNENIGNFGTDYLFRAGVAQVGLVANTQDEAMYEAGLLDSWYLPLNGWFSSYKLHFAAGQLPPADAFWSITVYDADGKLVANTAEQYSVSNSRPAELIYAPDGSLDIIFAKTDPGDPNANWLAIPNGGFSAYLRMYLPEQAALDRTWVPPAIQRRSIFGIQF